MKIVDRKKVFIWDPAAEAYRVPEWRIFFDYNLHKLDNGKWSEIRAKMQVLRRNLDVVGWFLT